MTWSLQGITITSFIVYKSAIKIWLRVGLFLPLRREILVSIYLVVFEIDFVVRNKTRGRACDSLLHLRLILVVRKARGKAYNSFLGV